MVSLSGREIDINILDYLMLLVSVVGDFGFTNSENISSTGQGFPR